MTLLVVFELIGTVAFAVSGSMAGLDKNMDLFGVTVLGVTTAVGGGVVRDLVLGVLPPSVFQHPFLALTAFAVSLIVFLPGTRNFFRRRDHVCRQALLVMDAAGLGSFTVVGVQAACTTSPGAGILLAVFVGVITGVGGGILRDILSGITPVVFVRHFYASASIAGGLLCALIWNGVGRASAMALGAALTFTLRLLAIRYRWNLPKAH